MFHFSYLFQFTQCLSLCLTHSPLCFFPSISASSSLSQPPLDHLARHSLRRYFTLMVLFFSLLSVFLSFPHLFVPLLHWRGQILAGMIAEPAFLSEYTIFALDHSKRPKTTQVASVVSVSSLPASSSSFFFSFSSSRYVPFSRQLRLWDSIEDCYPCRESLFPALCLLFSLDLEVRRHLVCRLTLHPMGVVVYIG